MFQVTKIYIFAILQDQNEKQAFSSFFSFAQMVGDVGRPEESFTKNFKFFYKTQLYRTKISQFSIDDSDSYMILWLYLPTSSLPWTLLAGGS